ncbi:MAG TPA: hypothetical protein VJO14_03840 [Bacteroidota bacterium]|nr:hypothetical protein [Bacteroidota bacterium]
MRVALPFGTALVGLLTIARVSGFAQEDLTDVSTVQHRLKLFAPAVITANLSVLGKNDRQALAEIIGAARVAEKIYLRQVWRGNDSLLAVLRSDTSRDGRARLRYFSINLGPWSVADRFRAFIGGVPAVKPSRGTIYPEDMDRSEWGAWFIGLTGPEQQKAAGPLYVIRRDSGGGLLTVPYHTEYADLLTPASQALRRAGQLVTDTTSRNALAAIADAFTDDGYAAAEDAIMASDGPINVMIAPSTRSVDGLFHYKKGFEAVVSIRNARATARMKLLEKHIDAVEKYLAVTPGGRADATGGMTLRVDDAVYLGGGSRYGAVGTAVRLPSDIRTAGERVSLTRLLRNVHEAKFTLIQRPIADSLINPDQAAATSFNAFFLHMMMHELSHRFDRRGADTAAGGQASTSGGALDALQEARADAAGLAGLQYLADRGTLDRKLETSLYPTGLSSLLRALRFGLVDAYAIGAAIQFNYFMERKAVVADAYPRKYKVDISKMKTAAKDLFGEISSVLGSATPAIRDSFMTKYAVMPAGLSGLRERTADIPYDLDPSFPIAD